jgi:multiple sugar transport system substrate-binding protein
VALFRELCSTPTSLQTTGEAAAETPGNPLSTGVEGHVVIMKSGNEWSEEMVAPFLQENPGITVELLEADTTRFYAMLAAGTPPDVMRTQAPAIPQYLARKILLDLTPFLETSTVLHLDDLASANNYYKALEIGEGPIYGMCKDWSPDFTMYQQSNL